LASNLSIIEKGASATRATAKTSSGIKLRQIFLQGKTAPDMPACEEQEFNRLSTQRTHEPEDEPYS
jgi:hypothetical protein